MSSNLLRALAASLALSGAAVMAQTAAQPAAQAATPATPPQPPVAGNTVEPPGTPPAPGAAAARAAEPSSSTRIIEDDRVRITETRVRGQLQRVTVRSKLTGQDYEIVVGPGGRDPSQNIGQRSDSTGQRAWSIFQF